MSILNSLIDKMYDNPNNFDLLSITCEVLFENMKGELIFFHDFDANGKDYAVVQIFDSNEEDVSIFLSRLDIVLPPVLYFDHERLENGDYEIHIKFLTE